jgi:hypothetical protein
MAISFITSTTSNVANTTIAENGSRQFLRIQNQDGTNAIFVNFGAAAVVGQCLRISAGVTMDFDASTLPVITRQLNVIASAGTPIYVAIDNI